MSQPTNHAADPPADVDEDIAIGRLIKRAIAGDAEAESELLGDVIAFLSPIATARHRSGLVGGRVSASDLVQASSMRVLNTLADFRGENESQWRGWLKAILLNELRAEHRYHHAARRSIDRQETCDEEIGKAKSTLGNLSRLVHEEQLVRLADALQGLSPSERQLIHMRFFDHRSLAEIAEELDVTVDAAAKRLYRVIDRLRCLL